MAFHLGAPGGIRTLGPRIRSPLLYPTELQAHFFTMCQKDLASYRLCLLLSRPNADEIVNKLKLAFTVELNKDPNVKSSVI